MAVVRRSEQRRVFRLLPVLPPRRSRLAVRWVSSACGSAPCVGRQFSRATLSGHMLSPSSNDLGKVRTGRHRIMPERIYISSSDGRLGAARRDRCLRVEDVAAGVARRTSGTAGRRADQSARRPPLAPRHPREGDRPVPGRSRPMVGRSSAHRPGCGADVVGSEARLQLGDPELNRSDSCWKYAAHASETWTPEVQRGALLAQGRDAQEEIATLLRTEDEADVDAFWKDVSTNLAAKRLRLLFVADRIPDPLARVVEFLNGQMPNIEVLAVEIKRFQGPAGRTLVPRVIGRTSAVRPLEADQDSG